MHASLRRRDFLATTALGTLAIGLAGCAGEPKYLGMGSAAYDFFGPEGSTTFVRMARLLYPHDELPDEVYEAVVERAMLASPPLVDDLPMYEAGLAALNGARGRPWYLLSEREQIDVLREIEGTPFFAFMRAGVLAQLYEQPEVWAMLGYPGPALPFGGYVDKGFDDIDWLPESV